MSRLLPHVTKGKTAFLCVDLQGAFKDRISNFANCVFVANRFAGMHEIFPENTKYIITEQYPKGLGKTVPEIKIPATASVISKTKFSCIVKPVEELLADVDNVVVFGIEGHVCVLQTAADLLDMGRRVILPFDAVGSQKKTDLDTALKLMGTWGPDCILTTSESLLLQMTKDASDPSFKKVSALLRDQPPIPL